MVRFRLSVALLLSLLACRREESGQTGVLLTLTTSGPVQCVLLSVSAADGGTGLTQPLVGDTLPADFSSPDKARWSTASTTVLIYSGNILGNDAITISAEGHRGTCDGLAVAQFVPTGVVHFEQGKVLPLPIRLTLTAPDKDGDGFSTLEDCDDNDPTTYPGAPELCDGKDHDCDGKINCQDPSECPSDGGLTTPACCGTTWIDVDHDPLNCGACGNVCPGGGGCPAPVCQSGGHCALAVDCKNALCNGASCTGGHCAGGVCCAGCVTSTSQCVQQPSAAQCGAHGSSCVQCPAPGACQVAGCNPAGTCTFASKPDGSSCGAGLTCMGGVCGCDPTACGALGDNCYQGQCVASGPTACAGLPTPQKYCPSPSSCVSSCSSSTCPSATVDCGGSVCLVPSSKSTTNICSDGTHPESCDILFGFLQACSCDSQTQPGTCPLAIDVCANVTASGNHCRPCGRNNTNGLTCKGGGTCNANTGQCN